MSLDDDRRRHRRADTPLSGGGTELTGGIVVIAVDPGRAPGLEHQRAGVVPLKRPPAAHREVVACRAPDRNGDRRTAGPVAEQVRQLDAKQLPDLFGHRGEYCLRRRRLGHQRGHPPQRGLLLDELTQPRPTGWVTTGWVTTGWVTAGWVTGHPPVRGTGAG